MKKDIWSEVSEILLDCLELETSERQKYLNELNISSEMRSEVENLLVFEENVDETFNLSAVDFSKGFFDEGEDQNAVIGQKFGAYQVVREIGFGGMGAVYLATRADGKFEQKIALKLLKREMNTAALRRRFQQERTILASLEHPNIARLLDAGTTDDKIPYIAMEYVEGLPIDDYCNKNNLDLNSRLDLFRDVCAVVNFAHRNLIVHRDLKPSNILVTDDGIPKLLDFGISKIISPEFEQINSATITQLGVMTPGYASPEQLQSQSVTTATDIYSLGIILYELLSGHRPFETKENDFKEIYKAILETDPPLPSAMIETVTSQLKDTTEAETAIKQNEHPKSFLEESSEAKINNKLPETEANKLRHTHPQTVNLSSNSLRGDLDNIVLKALRKEPERRYSSAENFAEDIKRYLRGLPVTARPNTFSYRTEKFFKRNKASAIAGVLILLAIIGGIIATLWQARVAQAERAKAEKRFNDVRKLANSNLFDVYPEIENLEGSIKARETLLLNVLDYLDSLANEAGGDIELQSELATAYEKVGDVQGARNNQNLGNYKTGAETYLKAQGLREAVYRAVPDNTEVKESLANNYYITARTLWYDSRTDEAEVIYEKGIRLRREMVADDPDSLTANNGLARILINAGAIPEFNYHTEEALVYFNEAQAIIEKMLQKYPGNDTLMKTLTLNLKYLAKAKVMIKKYDEAYAHLIEAKKISEDLARQFPKDFRLQRDVWLSDKQICQFFINKEDGENADEACLKTIEFPKTASEREPANAVVKDDLASAYWDVSRGFYLAKNYSAAIENADKAMETMSELIKKMPASGENKRYLAVFRKAKAEALIELNQLDKALNELRSATELLIPVVEADPKVTTYQYDLSNLQQLLAKVYFKKGDKTKAVENVDKAIGIIKDLAKLDALSGEDVKLLADLEKEKFQYSN